MDRIFASNDLSGTGTIPNFTKYKEFVVIISATGFYKSYYVPMIFMDWANTAVTFANFWQYGNASEGYATISINTNGYYVIGSGIGKNTSGSSISVWAR